MSGVGSDAKRQSLAAPDDDANANANNGEGSITPMPSSSPLGSPHKLTFVPSQVATSISDSSAVPTTATTTVTPPLQPDLVLAPLSSPPARVYIKIRDFGFPPTDERHLGLGADTPKANCVHRLNRKLGRPDRVKARARAAALNPSSSENAGSGSRRTDSIGSLGSVDSSDADAEEEVDEDEGWGIGINGWGKGGGGGGGGGGEGWSGFKMGMGRFSWTMNRNANTNGASASHVDKGPKGTGSSNGVFPSRKDLDMNFMEGSSSSSEEDERQRHTAEQGITEEFYGDDDEFDYDDFNETGSQRDGEEEQQEEPLYPGLYRALYAFEPEGTAEMKLDEGQMVRVVGKGGGIGWAVVVDERGGGGGSSDFGNHDDAQHAVSMPLKHALVPESYLEAVRLDWEDEEEGVDESVEDGEVVVDVKSGDT